MIFHTIEHRKPGHEGLEAIYQQEDQHIAEGASCFVCGGPLEGVMNPRRGCRSLAGGRGKRRRQSAAPPKWRAASRNPSLAVETAMPMRNPAPRPSGAVVARSPASPLRT